MSSPFDSLQTPLTKVEQLKALPATQSVGFMSLLLVKKIGEKTAKNGAPFLTVDLADKTGSFGVVIFQDSPYFPFFKAEAPEGSIILFTGITAYYSERFSPKVMEMRRLQGDELAKYPVDDLISCSSENPIAMWEELQAFIAKISHEKLRTTVLKVLEDIETEFRTYPAGISMHHPWRHGLLEHTLHVCRVAEAVLPLYKELDADMVRAGAVLHDAGKVHEYTYDMTMKFARPGFMEGHVVIGYRMARGAALKVGLDEDRLERLEHIILSHQGPREFGAAVLAATPEAVFVSYIDNLDAKMGGVQAALRAAAEGDEFSERLPILDTKLLVKRIQSSEK